MHNEENDFFEEISEEISHHKAEGIFEKLILEYIVHQIRQHKYSLSACRGATVSELGEWRVAATAMTTGSGVFWSVIPVAGVVCDMLLIVDGWIRSALGVGVIIARNSGYALTENIVDGYDFLKILGVWVGDYDFVKSHEAQHALLHKRSGTVSITKLVVKFSVKLSAKIALKLGAKLAGAVPYAGSAASGAVNAYFMTELLDAAETYYSGKFIHKTFR